MHRIYLEGPMTGLPEFNFPLFDAEAARLRSLGYDVVNPAEHGIIDGYEWADYMKLDIPQLITCDTVALLPGWHQSKGVRLEHHIACELGIIRINAADIRKPAREAVPA